MGDIMQFEQQKMQPLQQQQQQQQEPLTGTSMITMVTLQAPTPTGHCSNFNATSTSVPHGAFSSSNVVDYAALNHSSSLMSTDAVSVNNNNSFERMNESFTLH